MKLYRIGFSLAIVPLGFCALSFNANAQQSILQLQQDVSSITSVRTYCVYLDKSIPNAFQNYIWFMQQLGSTTGKENLTNADVAEKWNEVLKSNSQAWGALGCTQLIYGAQQGKSR